MATERLQTDVGLITGMVWVSNQSSGAIVVSITNKTGGDNREFTLPTKSLEVWVNNHWQRNSDETATVKLSTGKVVEFTIGKDSFVNIYDDSVVMWDCKTYKSSSLKSVG